MPKFDPILDMELKTKFGYQILDQPEIASITTNSTGNNRQTSEESLNETIMSKAKMISNFQQYNSYIVVVSFIGGGNRIIWRKPLKHNVL
jgi:hypothetical protein